jgi:hypothetical protein
MSRGPHRRWRDHDLAARTRLYEVAAAQGGVITPADATAHGVDPTTFERLVARAVLGRVRYGVYADVAVLDRTAGDPRAGHLLAAAAVLRTLTAAAALTHVSGVLAWDGPLPYSALPTAVRVWRAQGQDHRGGHDARSTVFGLQEGDLVRRRGVLVVPAAVAAVHACFDLPERWCVAACDFMLNQGHATQSELHAAIDLLRAVRGHARVGRLVRMSRSGAQSPLESLSRLVLCRAGVPEPRLQVPIYDELGLIGYVDMLIEGWGVIVEADGDLKYGGGDPAVLVAEKRREDRLRALGYEVERWTWDDVLHDPDRLVRGVLAAAARSRLRTAPLPG